MNPLYTTASMAGGTAIIGPNFTSTDTALENDAKKVQ